MTLSINQLKNITVPMLKGKQWSALTGNCPPVIVSMYDILMSFINSNTFSIYTDTSIDGNGTVSSPLGIAQQGASSGQVLTWNGSKWLPANPVAAIQSLSLVGSDITLTAGGSIPVEDLISADSNNIISAGTDGLLYASTPDVLPTATVPGQIIYWTGLAYEVAAETIHNANPSNGTTDVSLSATPISVLPVKVFLNGVLQRNTLDYTISGNTITFLTAFANNARVTVFYYT